MLDRAVAGQQPGAVFAVLQNAGSDAKRKEDAGNRFRLGLPGEIRRFFKGRHKVVHRRQQRAQQIQGACVGGD